MVAYAHCFYVNAAQLNGIPPWQVTDFELSLTRQQPTHWNAGPGRADGRRSPVSILETSHLSPRDSWAAGMCPGEFRREHYRRELAEGRGHYR